MKKTERRKHALRKSRYEEVLKPTEKGQKPIHFQKGGLHESLGVPQGEPIPASKMQAALSGRYGAKAQKQAQFARNVLTGPK